MDVQLIDVDAWTVVAGVATNISNSGELNWTFPSSLPFEGPCGRTYQFYVQNVQRTEWTYGPHFTVVCEIPVAIDIKPGSYPNVINLGSHGLVPVAILSSEDFDATTVDPETVELAGADVAVRGKSNKYMAHEEDVNGDGLVDLMVQVATENLDPGSFQDGLAVLTGNLLEEFGGTPIEGSDEITIVPSE